MWKRFHIKSVFTPKIKVKSVLNSYFCIEFFLNEV
jgi:hypothetical protein